MIEKDTVNNQKDSDWIKLFNSVTTMSSMGVHVVDLKTREMYFSNEAGFQLIDEKPCDYNGRTCYEVFFGLDHPCDNCRLEQTKQGITKHEVYVPEADKTFLTNTEITTWKGKDVLVEYITDITELRREQQELKASEELYKKRIVSIMQSCPDALGSFLMNLSKDFVTSQISYYSYIQKKSDKSISAYLEELRAQIPSKDYDKYIETFSRQNLIDFYNSGEDLISMTHRFQFLDKMRWITTSARILFNPITRDLEAYMFAVDVTDKILSKQVIQKLINLRYDILALIYPKDGCIDFRYAGNEFKEAPQISMDQYERYRLQSAFMFGRKGANDFMNKTEINTIIKNLDKNGRYTFTMEMETKGRKHYKCYSCNYLSKDDQIILATVQDVTNIYVKEKKQMEVIQEALAQAEKANTEKAEFISKASRDLKMPLNEINDLVEVLMQGELPADVKEKLQQIQESGSHMMDLITNPIV